jgi:cysteine synthase A
LKKLAGSVLDLVGATPLVRLRSFEAPGGAEVWAKAEFLNPGGSVKDRIALGMLAAAEKRGALKPGQGVVIEPTSGNTGVGLAMVCAVKGWRCVLVMPEGLPARRTGLLKAYGAEIVLTPFELGMSGAIERAEALQRQNPGWVMPMQFSNGDNPAAHRATTGPELWKALGPKLAAFVAGVGTGGTVTGVGQFLKRKDPGIQVAALEPSLSPVLSGGAAGAHRIFGIGAGFVPVVLNKALLDRVFTVSDAEAMAAAAQSARKEGLLVGISAGANLHAARLWSAELPAGRAVATVLCDGGALYLDDEGNFA